MLLKYKGMFGKGGGCMKKRCDHCIWWDLSTHEGELCNQLGEDQGEPCGVVGYKTTCICRENSSLNRTEPYEYCSKYVGE